MAPIYIQHDLMPEIYAAVGCANKRLSMSLQDALKCLPRSTFFPVRTLNYKTVLVEGDEIMIRQPMSQKQRLATETLTCLFCPICLLKNTSGDLCVSSTKKTYWVF